MTVEYPRTRSGPMQPRGGSRTLPVTYETSYSDFILHQRPRKVGTKRLKANELARPLPVL